MFIAKCNSNSYFSDDYLRKYLLQLIQYLEFTKDCKGYRLQLIIYNFSINFNGQQTIVLLFIQVLCCVGRQNLTLKTVTKLIKTKSNFILFLFNENIKNTF